MSETRPILIVGAGPTGMTAAMELARFGVPVRLIDKYVAPPQTSRALAVQARTLELMHQRGLAGEMLRLGNKGLLATMYADGKQLGSVNFRGIDSRFNFILLLAQSETERILREHLASVGVTVETQTELVAFSQAENSASGVLATLSKGDGSVEELSAAYMIDAEGAHSVVRHSMDLAFDGKSLPNTYALADLYIDGELPSEQLSIFLAETGLLAAFPLGGRRFRIIATEKKELRKDAHAPDLAYMAAAWADASHVPVQLRDMQWSSRFRINSRVIGQLRHMRIFFGGDSAHVHSPAGGQGMNTGIQDMINLGWKLAMVYHGLAADKLLDTYDEERMPIVQELVSTTERATDLFNSNSYLLHVAVTHGLPALLSLDAVRRKGAGMLSELGGNYRNSSLSAKTPGRGSLRAGDRFPDIPMGDNEARDVSGTLALLDPTRLMILELGDETTPGLQDLADVYSFCCYRSLSKPSKALTEAIGDSNVAVIRPDGYLLCAGGADAVLTELDRWFLHWLPGSMLKKQ